MQMIPTNCIAANCLVLTFWKPAWPWAAPSRVNMVWALKKSTACACSSAPKKNEQMFGIKRAFDREGLLNPGKVIPTLHRCAEYGKMLVRAGQIKHPDLPRF